MVGERDGVEELEDWDTKEPSGEKTDETKDEDRESETNGEFDETREVLVEARLQSHEEGLDDVLAKEGENSGRHGDDAIDGLNFVGGGGVDGVFGGVDEVDAEETKAEDEETLAS